MPRDTHAYVTTRFTAHAAEGSAHAAPGAETFEAAALQLADQWDFNADGELVVHVIDQSTGRQQRFAL